MARPKKDVADAPIKEQEARAAKTSADMVTVACNMPHGLRFMLGEKAVLIRGNATHLIGQEKGIIPVGRYGYTRVAADDWAEIKRVYGELPAIKNGLIFAESSKERAEDRAEEQSELRHGREPFDPAKAQTDEVKPGSE